MLKKKKILKKLLSIFFVFAFVLATFVPVVDFAYAGGSDNPQPMNPTAYTEINKGIFDNIYGLSISTRKVPKEYALKIETGIMAGDEVEEIYIGYYDENNYSRYKVIGPKDVYAVNNGYGISNIAGLSYDEIKKKATTSSQQAQAQTQSLTNESKEYILAKTLFESFNESAYCTYLNQYYGSYDNINNGMVWDDVNGLYFAKEIFKDSSYDIIGENSILEPNSTTSIFFTSEDELKNVFSISIFMNRGDEVFSMKSCELYEVENRDKIYMYSDVSTHPYANFNGKLLYSVNNIYPDGLTVNLQKLVVGNGTPDAQCFTFLTSQVKESYYRILCDKYEFYHQKYLWNLEPEIGGCGIRSAFQYLGTKYFDESVFTNWRDYPVTEDFDNDLRKNNGGLIYFPEYTSRYPEEETKLYEERKVQCWVYGGYYYQAIRREKAFTTVNVPNYGDPILNKINSSKVKSAVLDSNNQYVVALTFADKYAGGLNSFVKGIDKDLIDFNEVLYANVYYQKTDGRVFNIEVPVIKNALFNYIKSSDAYKKRANFSSDDYNAYKSENSVTGLGYQELDTYSDLTGGQVYSFGQQGDTICFDLNLPDCQKINEIRFSYRSNYEKGLEKEEISILGAKVYSKKDAKINYATDGTLNATVTGTPKFSYAASTADGLSIVTSSNTTITFKEGDVQYPKRSYNNMYLIKLVTDSVQPSGTIDDVEISFQYEDTSGNELNTSAYLIRDYINDYFGYWVGETEEREILAADGETLIKSNTTSAAYPYCMREGGEIYMIVRLNNLSEFLGITLSMDKSTEDEWQLDGIQINRIDDLSSRKMRTIKDINEAYGESGKNTATVKGVTVDRVYYRDVIGDVLYAENGLDLLVQKGGSISHMFGDEEEEEHQEMYVRDYSEYYYSMDWETANKDLGFTLPTKTYTVMVEVPTNISAGTSDDGTGSRNLFYFQLVFKNGKSAYVLANTQLQSDGFIAGATSSFMICTNEDYGDLISINIIPDDIDENSDKLDKLCISKITVVKDNKNGINKSYVIDEDFWVATEYRTQDAGSINTSKIGRKEGDLVVNKIVETSAYMLTYEIEITTGSYKPGDAQFEGYLLATIAYYNSKGETHYIYDYDVVHAMYNYRNETWVKKDDSGSWCSDPTKMFKGDRTDRFQISIPDAVSIKSISFKVKAKNATAWTIKQISIGVVTSEGILYVNQNGEMQMKYQNRLDPQLLVDKVINHNLPYTMTLSGIDSWDGYEFQFDENTVSNIDAESKQVSVVERVPSSANDTANIYVYLPKSYQTLENTYPDLYDYKVYAELQYEGAHYSYKNKTELKTAIQPDGSMILFATGLNAQNFLTLTNLKIYSNVLRDVNHKYYGFVDHAVVQQVRGNTVIDSYTIGYNYQDIMQGPINMTGADTSRSRESYQDLAITFGEGTVGAQLNPMNYDIAVSFRYTTSNDPASAGRVYYSPYVFLTDQDITSIQAGKTIKIQFHEDYVKEIVGVDMIATGGIKAFVENGYMNNYRDGLDTPYNKYGINEGGEILPGGTLYDVVENDGDTHSMTPVEITFVTADAISNANVGTSKPVTISIKYKTLDGSIKTKTYNNAQLYLESGKTFKEPGGTATMSLNLVDFDDFRTITITPSDQWYVKSVTAKAENQAGEKKWNINKKITSDEPCVLNFASIKVRANAITDTDNKTTENGTITVSAKEGTTMSIKVLCDGSLDNFGYKAIIEKVEGDKRTQVGETITNSTPKGTIEITLPTITSGEEELYCVTITSDEDPSLISIVNIKSHK